MAIAGSILLAVAIVIQVTLFAMKSAAWSTTWRRFGVPSAEDAEAMRSVVYLQGFFHLFIAAGTAFGLLFYWTTLHTAGTVLVCFCAGCMVLGAVVLAVMGRGYLKLALIQGVVPLVALMLIWLA